MFVWPQAPALAYARLGFPRTSSGAQPRLHSPAARVLVFVKQVWLCGGARPAGPQERPDGHTQNQLNPNIIDQPGSADPGRYEQAGVSSVTVQSPQIVGIAQFGIVDAVETFGDQRVVQIAECLGYRCPA